MQSLISWDDGTGRLTRRACHLLRKSEGFMKGPRVRGSRMQIPRLLGLFRHDAAGAINMVQDLVA